jgi:S-adenosyl-L-methionine hydrolase (adenosine-forming)
VSQPILTFTSDFGLDDWFVGVVHGVIHGVCPGARVVDLTHAIPAGDVASGAFVLEAACPDFPPGTIHLAVVDPGVGTARRALLVAARGQRFVGPDNGLLEWALADAGAEARSITEARWFRQPVSRTFHGRDVFAPVAAHVACGERPEAFGPLITDPVRLARRAPHAMNGVLEGCVMFVDRFGNALTNLGERDLAAAFPGVPHERLEVTAAARAIRGLARSYGDAPVGTLLAIVGSSGRLEVAQVGGHCAERLGIGVGDAITVRAAE